MRSIEPITAAGRGRAAASGRNFVMANQVDVYFSADVETDGPIPGPYSMLSFALVYAGTFDGSTFQGPASVLSRTEAYFG